MALVLGSATMLCGCGGGGDQPKTQQTRRTAAQISKPDSVRSGSPPQQADSNRSAQATADKNASGDRGARGGLSSSGRIGTGRIGTGRIGGRSAEEEAAGGRPEDVAEWKRQDYLDARIENDRRLSEAVRYAGEHWSNSASLVRALAELLTVEKRPETDDASSGSTSRGNPYARPGGQRDDSLIAVSPETVQEIIVALGKNETSEALAVLEELVTGKQEAALDFDKTVETVIKALALEPNLQRETLLLRLFTKPEIIKPAPSLFVSQSAPRRGGRFESDLGGRGARIEEGNRPANQPAEGEIDMLAIQEQIVREAGPNVSARFRLGLAKYLENPQVTMESARIAEDFLCEDDPRNLAAQAQLLQNDKTASTTRQQVVDQLIEGSGVVVDMMLGVPPDEAMVGKDRGPSFGRGRGRGTMFEDSGGLRFSRSGSGQNTPQDSGRPSARPSVQDTEETDEETMDVKKLYYDFARVFWNDKTATALAGQISGIQPGDEGQRSKTPLVVATIPLETTRKALAEAFQEQEDAGPQLWTSLGMFDGKSIDPGVLVLAKNVYHQPTARRSSPTRTNGSYPRNSTAQQDPMEREWASAMERFVEALCQRCEVAAKHAPESTTTAAETAPIKIPSNATVLAQHNVHWPGDTTSALGNVKIAPLELHYVRFQQESLPSRALAIYNRLAGRSEQRTISDGVWIDGFNKGEQKSTDIRITGLGGGSRFGSEGRYDRGRSSGRSTSSRGEADEEPALLTIEVLTVSIAELTEE